MEDELGGVGCLLLQRVDHVPVRAEGSYQVNILTVRMGVFVLLKIFLG